ncbi:acyl carrier protein [Streptomyces huiliensis]|uniref:acyl carrier protein n=1 Tax=Streptomyces huiliensis TaxID=2876027 RepID=UPI001CBBF632|nr:acyl carrier protein [Streptomyces huiliensis]MBZ4319362.1 acyl carrier protein [Streptomyces huiliensis]
MAEMTIEQLTRLLRDCAGEEEGVDLEGDVLDVPFTDLGYDSLAVLQAAGCVERDYGITLPDETVAEATTPRLLLTYVNERLSTPAAN